MRKLIIPPKKVNLVPGRLESWKIKGPMPN